MAEQVGRKSGAEGVLPARALPTAEAGSAHEELLDYRVLNEVAEMVTLMGSKNATEAEKEKLEEIKEQYEMTKAELDQVNELNQVSRTASAVTSLRARVKNLVLKLDADVEKAAEKIGSKFHQLDADGDGIISEDEIRRAIETRLKRNLEACALHTYVYTYVCICIHRHTCRSSFILGQSTTSRSVLSNSLYLVAFLVMMLFIGT